MTTVIASIVVIGIIVFIHELGHFAAAKFSGVKVEIFSLGFGPRLWGFRLGETEYIISAIPLGGFVKMEGDSPDEGGEDVEPQYGERSFLGKSKRTRALIVAAGPAMNFLLAAIIYAGLAYHTGMAVFTTREIGIVEEGSPAQAAGLRAGDEITQVDGATVEN
jgi:regulator of sigma E protease